MNDESIIEHLFRRDEAGLSAISAAYGAKLRAIALQICGNAANAVYSP